ncbi:GTP-binding protein ERG [Porphyridium purpureum]|uniref:GTP-binding protein ERG n=1 Tax=Porphyridium purpureum TaxID=35688 RepID=A0A5J4YWH8_PORPP|nr:GTP-binding protein ERG [Porphyridium purpureum]|eukprot:POR4658..scf209_3
MNRLQCMFTRRMTVMHRHRLEKLIAISRTQDAVRKLRQEQRGRQSDTLSSMGYAPCMMDLVRAEPQKVNASLKEKLGLPADVFHGMIDKWIEDNPKVDLTLPPRSATETPTISPTVRERARAKYGVLRTANVALVGAPNAGKSSLINALVDRRIAAVHRKRNTTQRKVTGCLTEAERQVVLFDTPGILYNAENYMALGWNAAFQADVCAAVIDASVGNVRRRSAIKSVVRKIVTRRNHDANGPTLLILTKMDIVNHRTFNEVVHEWTSELEFDAVFTVSTPKAIGVSELRAYLLKQCKEGDWLLNPNIPSGDPAVDVVNEAVHEQVLEFVHEELAYRVHTSNRHWTELPNGVLRIDQVLSVPDRRHIPILLGTDAAKVNRMRDRAQAILKDLFQREIMLNLHVQARNSSI